MNTTTNHTKEQRRHFITFILKLKITTHCNCLYFPSPTGLQWLSNIHRYDATFDTMQGKLVTPDTILVVRLL